MAPAQSGRRQNADQRNWLADRTGAALTKAFELYQAGGGLSDAADVALRQWATEARRADVKPERMVLALSKMWEQCTEQARLQSGVVTRPGLYVAVGIALDSYFERPAARGAALAFDGSTGSQTRWNR